MRYIRPAVWLAALAGLFVAAMTALAYTTGQAEAGQQVFATYCSACHGPALQGGLGPALVGPAFRANWRDAAALLEYVSRQMPLSAPGTLSKERYRNVVAFLLQRNGVAADGQPLDEQSAKRVEVG